jgi:hypothetical protein
VSPDNVETAARDQRLMRPAALASFAAVALYLLSVIIEGSSGLHTSGAKSLQLQSFHDNSGTLLLVTIIRSLGFLLMSVPLFHLFRAARARNPRVKQEMVAFSFIGPLLFAAQGIVAWVASNNLANDFVAKASGSKHPAELASQMIDADSAHKVASALLIPAVLGLMVALLYFSFQAMRTGLLTRFGGSLGMALGAAMFLIFPIALIVLMLWLLYMGTLFMGWAPGGRPPAWAAGEAIAWPTPGERAAASLAGEGGAPGGDIAANGDSAPSAGAGEEVPGPRRKRKQRS